jgi:hypothetical protein
MFYSKKDIQTNLNLNLNTLNKYFIGSTPDKNQIKQVGKIRLYSKDYLTAVFTKFNRSDLITLLNQNIDTQSTLDYKDISKQSKTAPDRLNEVFLDQITDLKDQIKIKDNLIENLTRLLENQQTLLKNQQSLELVSNPDKTKTNPLSKFLDLFKKQT